MIWIIGFLTVLLVLDCLFLMLLVLVQLPKKDAGMGQAFGGATTDALFGAGSGNALTKMTKYSAAVFFILTLSLSILNAQQSKTRKSRLEEQMQTSAKQEKVTQKAPVQAEAPAKPAPLTVTNTVPKTAPAPANSLLLSTGITTNPKAAATNTPSAPSAPPATEKPK